MWDMMNAFLLRQMLDKQGEEARKQREREEHEYEAMIREAKARNR